MFLGTVPIILWNTLGMIKLNFYYKNICIKTNVSLMFVKCFESIFNNFAYVDFQGLGHNGDPKVG